MQTIREAGRVMAKLSVRKGREWQIKHGHPWLFSGAISQAPKCDAGDIVELVDTNGKFLATGYFNAACDIAFRVLSKSPNEPVDGDFIKRRVQAAVRLRTSLIDREVTDAYRLINAEGDFLPGIIVDQFADVLVVQSHTAGGDKLLPMILPALVEVVQPHAIVLRNDASVRKREGLELMAPKVVHGALDTRYGGLIVKENKLKFKIDPSGGQKTGFFTDQRDKRVLMASVVRALPPGARLANCFSYSGSFAIYALRENEGIKTINVDESQSALELARESYELNGLPAADHEFTQADVFAWLDEQRANGSAFEAMILDPPAFSKGAKSRDNALKAYIHLNKSGLLCCAPGSYLLTCSCSGSVTLADLEDALQTAAGQAKREVQLLQVLKHGVDHPTSIALPESQYLKALLCHVI